MTTFVGGIIGLVRARRVVTLERSLILSTLTRTLILILGALVRICVDILLVDFLTIIERYVVKRQNCK